MTDAWHSIKIREFEHVRATATVALLRVSGKAPRWQSADGPRPVLLADNGLTVRRFAPIPSPPDGRGVLRAAYSVGADLVSSDTVFSLELNDGFVIALPAPAEGAIRIDRRSEVTQTQAEAPKPDDDRRSAEDRRTGLVYKLTELSANLAESEQARSEHEAAAVEARTETEQAREQLQSLHARVTELEAQAAQAQERANQAEAVAAEAQERITAAREQADESARVLLAQEQEQAQARLAEVQSTMEQQLALAQQRGDGAALEAAAAQEEIATLRERLSGLEATIADQQARVDVAERQASEAVAARDEMERSVAPLRAAREAAEHQLVEARDAIRSLTTERDELSRQAAAFDGVAVKARERAAEAEAEAEKTASTLRELDVWRGELERRLTETTDELAENKQARSSAETELRRVGGELAEAEAKVELMAIQIESLTEQLGQASGGEAPADGGQLVRLAAELEELRAANAALEAAHEAAMADQAAARDHEHDEAVPPAPDPELGRLQAERHEISRQLRELVALLGDGQQEASDATGSEPSGDDTALAQARTEVEGLRLELAAEREGAADARAAAVEAQTEVIRNAAVAEARDLAEHELAEAISEPR